MTARATGGGAETDTAALAALATHVAAADPHTGYQKESEKAQTNGYASLDGSGKVPTAQLPSTGISAWTATTAYTSGSSYVSHSGALYLCSSSHTSGSTFNPAKWQRLGIGVYPNIEGIKLWGYGHSYVAGQFVQTEGRYTDRVKARYNMAYSNLGLGGSTMANAFFQLAKAGGSTWALANTGVIVLDCTTNDGAHQSADGAVIETKFQHALKAFLTYARLGTRTAETDASITYTGTWANSTQTGFSGDQVKFTTTNGDFAEIAFTGASLDLIFAGFDSGAITGCASIEVRIDGSLVETFSSHAQTKNKSDANYVPIAKSYRSLGSGAHTAKITHAGAGSSHLWFDCWGTPAANPVTVLVVKDPERTDNASFNTGRGVINALVDTVVGAAPFAVSDQSIVVVDPSTGWDATTMMAYDGLHPNDLGHQHIANSVGLALEALPYRKGQNNPNV